MNSVGIPLVMCLFLAAEDKPAPKVPVGKETTVATGPLDKEGYIDYETALNDRLKKGITAQTNANVLIVKVLGPRPEGAAMPAEYFKQLGIAEPPEKGDYLIGLHRYLKDHVNLNPDQIDEVYKQQARASRRPWSGENFPHLTAWLFVNEKPLALVIEATKCPGYFNPLASRRAEGGPSSLIGALLPTVQKCRELTTALTTRAMLRVHEGKLDEAWQDLQACHRLARLTARGGCLIELLVGLAIEQIACNADLTYLERAKLTAAQLRACLKDLQALPPLPPLADKIELCERFMCLDCLQMIRRGGIGGFALFDGGPAPAKLDPAGQGAMERVDWAPAYRDANRWYDRLTAALRLQDRAEREKQLDQIDQDLKALKKDAGDPEKLAGLIMAGAEPKVVGKAIGNVLITMLMPATRKVQNAGDRAQQVRRNLHVAFALAAYRLDKGRYPAKLDDLAPKYLATIPNDLFSGKALIYRPSETGYLFYSVGLNGKDEDGRYADDDPPGDDLGVRMPLPELKP
jgi:hypothetical protein